MRWLWITLPCCLIWGPVQAEPGAEGPDVEARRTAVALNYCRASFHRLRGNPSKRVLLEEQAHILNNLNLNGLADQEVVTLYTNVLDEIGRERIADREREVITQGYLRNVRHELLSRAFVLGAQVGTTQYVEAVRTGANSWWDYRTLGVNRDLDLWKIDKNRLSEVNLKSTAFLDTFWKLAQRKQIPDRWLVRGDDLDRLDKALAEPNLDVRLRVLQRMERFLECYPPYWYHMARTQQGLGQLFAASETYGRLETIAMGHFRKDEMLAAGLANRALIQAALRQPGAVATARRALDYAPGAWQANLLCARILEEDGDFAEAEDAILRNLDVDLERTQSLACLVGLYCRPGHETQLAARLADPRTVAELPTLLLLRGAARLGADRLPAAASRQLMTSLYALDSLPMRNGHVVFQATRTWELEQAQASLKVAEAEGREPRIQRVRNGVQLEFAVDAPEQGTPRELDLDLAYHDGPHVRVHMVRRAWTPELQAHAQYLNGRPATPFDLAQFLPAGPRTSYLITAIDVDDDRLAFGPSRATDDGPLPPLGSDEEGSDDDARPAGRILPVGDELQSGAAER